MTRSRRKSIDRVKFLRVSNEPCTDRMADGLRELVPGRTTDRLDVYGECRGNEHPEGVSLPAWLKVKQ